MADIKSKHSVHRAQGSRRGAHASTKPRQSTRKHRARKKSKQELPPSLRYTETKHGKTTIRRFIGRTIYRLEEIKGKLVDCVEIFNAGGDHSITVRFQDETGIHFSLEPGFTLFTEYSDWKTGDWRRLKRWPPIHSQGLRIP